MRFHRFFGVWASSLSVGLSLSSPFGVADRVTPKSAPSAYGSTILEKPGQLYEDGKASLERGLLSEADRLLQRLVDRHPSFEFRMDALLLLAKAKLGLLKPLDAVSTLQTYLEYPLALGARIDAEILLGQAYLDLGRFHEAYLVSFKLLDGESLKKIETEPTSLFKALLLKTEAQLGLNQSNRADRSIASLRSLIKQPDLKIDSDGVARIHQIELELKLRDCNAFPTQRILTEEQTRDQMRRRGLCVSEALPLFERVWNQKISSRTRAAAARLGVAYNAYRFAIQAPPLPPEKRTERQLRNYQLELVDRLMLDYQAHRKIALSFFERLGQNADSFEKRVLDEIRRDL